MTVFLATLAVYLLVAVRLLPYVEPPSGDQPHYLLQTISLVDDGDLDLRNNYTSDLSFSQFAAPGRRREGFRGIPIKFEVDSAGHVVARPREGGDAWYPKHGPGLPVLLIPGWLLGKALTPWLAWLTSHGGGAWPGTVVEMALIGALLAVQVWLLAWEVTGRRGVAYVVWAAVSFSTPQVLTGLTVFPEAPAALALIYAFRHLVVRQLPAEPWRRLLVGLALAGLPWLNPRFTLVAGCLALLAFAALWRRAPQAPPLPSGEEVGSRSLRERVRDVWVHGPPGGIERAYLLLVPLVVSLVLQRWFQIATFGSTAAVAQQYEGFYVPITLDGWLGGDWPGLLLAALGLLVDRQYGLLVFAPMYALAVVGLVALWRQPGGHWLVVGLGVVALPYAALTADFLIWWGGWSIPVRYLAVLTPLLAAPLAASLAELWGVRWYRGLFVVLAAAGVLVILVLLRELGDPRVEQAIFANPTRNPALLRWLDLRYGLELDSVLPGVASWFADRRGAIPWPQIAGCLAFFGVVIGLGLYGLRSNRPAGPPARYQSGSIEPAMRSSRGVSPPAEAGS